MVSQEIRPEEEPAQYYPRDITIPSESPAERGYILCYSYRPKNCTAALKSLNISEIDNDTARPPECAPKIIRCKRLCEAKAFVYNKTELKVCGFVCLNWFISREYQMSCQVACSARIEI